MQEQERRKGLLGEIEGEVALNYNNNIYNNNFSHIYVERKVQKHPRTISILEKFPNANIIEIDHYKDIFCRKKQSVIAQNNAKALILAKNESDIIYEGAPVCQNFGNKYFYYCSCMMNCLFDCEYCFLKGMYPSSNIVIFVNLEDTFDKIRQMLKEHDMYICVSYDADLIACEDICGYVGEWLRFAAKTPGLTIEIRTKSGRTDIWERYKEYMTEVETTDTVDGAAETETTDTVDGATETETTRTLEYKTEDIMIPSSRRAVIAFTISPSEIAEKFEHYAGTTKMRIDAAKKALECGFNVRLCFDPMIYCRGWKEAYEQLVKDVFDKLDAGRIFDVSVGSFRISQDYIKKMRKEMPTSAVVNFPFENVGGYYEYPKRIKNEMEMFLISELRKHVPDEKIFRD